MKTWLRDHCQIHQHLCPRQVTGHAGTWDGIILISAAHVSEPTAAALLAAGAQAVVGPLQGAAAGSASAPADARLHPGFLAALVQSLGAGRTLLAALQEAGEGPSTLNPKPCILNPWWSGSAAVPMLCTLRVPLVAA